MDDAPILDIRQVGERFPGVRALHDVSFVVARGEIHALVGENGAGKSTLMTILSGVYPDYDGQVVFDGAPLALSSPRDAQRRGIAIIYQELNLIPELTVAENIFLGREPRTATGLLDAERMNRDASALLARLNLAIPPDRPVKWLRVGELQLVEVARALSLDARLLILDEPTSALSQMEIDRLFAVVAGLKADGVTMIYISNKFDEVFRIADRVTVLRDGECVGSLPIAETDAATLIRMMVGRSLSDLYPKEDAEVGDEALRVEHLHLLPDERHGGRDLQDISFTLRRGEIVGVDGLPTPDGGIRSVLDGRINVTHVYPTGGVQAIDTAVGILEKGEVPPKEIILKSEEVTKDNAQQILDQFTGGAAATPSS